MLAKRSVKLNYFYNLLYQLAQVLIPIILVPYLSRTLLADGIGQYSFSYSIITYFTLFATFGFDNYAQREMSKVRDNKFEQSKMFLEIVFCRFLTVFASLALNFILLGFNAYGAYTNLILILNLNILSIAFDFSFFFRANEEFGKIAITHLAIKIIMTVLIMCFVKTVNDVWIYTLINSAALLVFDIFLMPFLIKRLVKVPLKELKVFKHLLPSLKLFIPAIAVSLYTVLDKSLIGIITHSDAENGYYEQAEKIVKLSLTMVTSICAIYQSRNSYEISTGNIEMAKENIYKSFNFVWVLGLPMMFGIMLISKSFVAWFLGPGFERCIILLCLFAPLIVSISLSNVLGLQYLLPFSKDKEYTIAILCGGGVNLIINIPLIWFWGSVGATISTVVAETSIAIIMLCMARKDLQMKELFKTMVKPLIASLIMIALVLPLTIFLADGVLTTFIIVAVGVIVYFVSLLILKEKMLLNYLHLIASKIFKK